LYLIELILLAREAEDQPREAEAQPNEAKQLKQAKSKYEESIVAASLAADEVLLKPGLFNRRKKEVEDKQALFRQAGSELNDASDAFQRASDALTQDECAFLSWRPAWPSARAPKQAGCDPNFPASFLEGLANIQNYYLSKKHTVSLY
jgi:hypothetical protein